jgi:hypothetical protein
MARRRPGAAGEAPTARRRPSVGRRPLRVARARSGQPPSPRGPVVSPRSGRRSASPQRRLAAGAAQVPIGRYGTRPWPPRRRRSGDASLARPRRPGAVAALHAAGSQQEGRRAATLRRTARILSCPAAARRSASRAARTLSPRHHNRNRTHVLYRDAICGNGFRRRRGGGLRSVHLESFWRTENSIVLWRRAGFELPGLMCRRGLRARRSPGPSPMVTAPPPCGDRPRVSVPPELSAMRRAMSRPSPVEPALDSPRCAGSGCENQARCRRQPPTHRPRYAARPGPRMPSPPPCGRRRSRAGCPRRRPDRARPPGRAG